MGKPKIRKDEGGLHLRTNGQVYRPGAVRGFGERNRMDDGGLSEGTAIAVFVVDGTDLVRIPLGDGTVTHWHAEGTVRLKGLMEPPVGAVWKADGRRDYRGVMIG